MENAKFYAFIILFLCFYGASYAQKIDTTLQISGVEVYGKALNKENETIIVNDLNRNQEDAGKILTESPNISLIKRGNYASDPVIRGFKGDQLQLLSNGFVQSNPACPNRMDAPSSHINMENLESIEIIKGPYSVRYGMNTGGVVNFQSKDLKSSKNFQVNGKLGLYYQSNGDGKDGQAHLQISDQKYTLKLYGGIKDFGNYKSGDGTEILSSFKHSDYGATAAYFVNTKNKLIVDWKQSFAKDVLFAALPMDGDFDNASTASLRYVFKDSSKRLYHAEIKAYGNVIDHQMSNKNRPNYAAAQSVSKLFSQTYGGRGELGLRISDHHTLLLGADYKKIAKQGDRERLVFVNTCTGMVINPAKLFLDAIWQHSEQSDLGIFVESRWALSQNLQWNAGLRADQVSSNISEPAADFALLYPDLGKKDHLALMANSRLSYLFSEGISLEWSVGLGQRAPELIELYINHLTVGVDAYEYVGNPDLKMEQNFQNDLKFSLNNHDFHLEFGVFYSMLKNYIQANLDTTLNRKYMTCLEPKFAKRYENVADARLYGFETLLSYHVWKGMNAYGSLAYTLGDNITLDEPLAEIPPMEIKAGINYKALRWNANLNARFVMAQDNVSSSFNESPSDAFQVFNFAASYNIWKGLMFNLSIENILDANYVEHLSRSYKNQTIDGAYYEPGRNFILGLSYQF